jgi:hypothetical protein
MGRQVNIRIHLTNYLYEMGCDRDVIINILSILDKQKEERKYRLSILNQLSGGKCIVDENKKAKRTVVPPEILASIQLFQGNILFPENINYLKQKGGLRIEKDISVIQAKNKLINIFIRQHIPRGWRRCLGINKGLGVMNLSSRHQMLKSSKWLLYGLQNNLFKEEEWVGKSIFLNFRNNKYRFQISNKHYNVMSEIKDEDLKWVHFPYQYK